MMHAVMILITPRPLLLLLGCSKIKQDNMKHNQLKKHSVINSTQDLKAKSKLRPLIWKIKI